MIYKNQLADPKFIEACTREYLSVYKLNNKDVKTITSSFAAILEYVAYRNSLYGEVNTIDGYRDIITDSDGYPHKLTEIDALIPKNFSVLSVPTCVTVDGNKTSDYRRNLLTKKSPISYTPDVIKIEDAARYLKRQQSKDNDLWNPGFIAKGIEAVSNCVLCVGSKCSISDKAIVPVHLDVSLFSEEYYLIDVANYCYRNIFESLF